MGRTWHAAGIEEASLSGTKGQVVRNEAWATLWTILLGPGENHKENQKSDFLPFIL